MLNLKNKKATVMGLGLYEEGSGISAVRFLLSAGTKVTVTDLKTEEQLSSQLQRLGRLKSKIKFVLGEHREEDFVAADLIIRNPGVPKSSKFLKLARKNKIPIYSDISLFFELCGTARIIGVTGTRGKSTTSTLIFELLKAKDKFAVLGGNITKSPLAQLAQVSKGGKVVLELSSWMLESLADIKRSPHIAVFTNIYPDHLNTYEGIDDYAEAKANIFRYQTAQDFAILNRDNAYTKKFGGQVSSQRYWFSLKKFTSENGCYLESGNICFRQDGKEQKVCSASCLKLPGEHNLANALGAVCAAKIAGVSNAAIAAGLKKFRGVPNRLELIRTIKGVAYYNDTTSTTPEAAMAALSALGGKKNIILIAGGSDKSLDFSTLAKKIKNSCKSVVLLAGTGTDRLQREIESVKYAKGIVLAQSMKQAVDQAAELAAKGDIILLSPACASFGMFKNEFDRGSQFVKFVKSL